MAQTDTQTQTHKHIATYRLNRPNGRFRENIRDNQGYIINKSTRADQHLISRAVPGGHQDDIP